MNMTQNHSLRPEAGASLSLSFAGGCVILPVR
jgi:hypothetical protein